MSSLPTRDSIVPPTRSLFTALRQPGAWCLLTATAAFGQPLDFSIDSTSPEAWSPADIIEARGTERRVAASDLGLLTSDDVVGLSYGNAEIEVLADYNFVRVAYSVDRASTGDGGLVTQQANGNGAAGDKFGLTVVNFGGQSIPLRGPYMISDAPIHQITPQPGESELDALSIFNQSGAFPVFLALSAPGYDPATVYIVQSAGATPEVFATPTDLSLVTGDVIDALAVGTTPVSLPPPLTLGPEVVIWISLQAGSPTRAIAEARGGDGILQVYPSGPGVVIDAPALDLASTDELDALTGLDPGESVDLSRVFLQQGDEPHGLEIVHTAAGSLIFTAEMDFSKSTPRGLLHLRGEDKLSGAFQDAAIITGTPIEGFPFGGYVELSGVAGLPSSEPGFLADILVYGNSLASSIIVDGGTPVETPPGPIVMRFRLTEDHQIIWNTESGSFGNRFTIEDIEVHPDGALSLSGSGIPTDAEGNELPDRGDPGIPDGFVYHWQSFMPEDPLGSPWRNAVQIPDASVGEVQVARWSYPLGPLGAFRELFAVRMNDNDQTNLNLHVHRPDSEEITFMLAEVNPDPSNSTSVIVVMGTDPETGDPVVLSHIPFNSASFAPIDLPALVATPDALFVAVNTSDAFEVRGRTFNEGGGSRFDLLRFGAEEDSDWWNQPIFETTITSDIPSDVQVRITDMGYDPTTDSVGFTFNSTDLSGSNEPVAFDLINEETGSRQRILLSEYAGIEGSFTEIDAQTMEYQTPTIRAFSAPHPFLPNEFSFYEVESDRGKWQIYGRLNSAGRIFPSKTAINYTGSPFGPGQSFVATIPGGYPPSEQDTDGDGWSDLLEQAWGSNHLDRMDHPVVSIGQSFVEEENRVFAFWPDPALNRIGVEARVSDDIDFTDYELGPGVISDTGVYGFDLGDAEDAEAKFLQFEGFLHLEF